MNNDLYTFDNLFCLLLANGFDHEDALNFILADYSLIARVFQEKIHNMGYENLSAADTLPPEEAAHKARFISDMLKCVGNRA